jgi:predicted kinase
MLRAGIDSKTHPLVLMGLSEGNIERLKDGHPIRAEFTSFGVSLPGAIAVIYGKTEQDIAAQLKADGLMAPDTKPLVDDPRLAREAEIREKHKHILIATVGLPRSGKTTWSRDQSYPVVNPDSIRLALHGQRFAAEAERYVWAVAHTMVDALFLSGHRHVILDATNFNRKRRDEWKTTSYGTYFKLFEASAAVCRARAEAAADAEILPVIARMAAGWEPLGEDELRW